MRVFPHLHPALAYWLCDQLSVLGPLLPGWQRVQRNLKYVLPSGSEATRRHHAREVTASLLKNYYDLLRLHAVSKNELARMVDVEGLDNLLGALSQGKGVLVAMPHMGTFSTVAEPVATISGHSILVVVEHMDDPSVHDLFTTLRKRENIEVVAIGPAVGRRIMRQLRNGQIVVLFGDRTIAEATVEVDFFGAPAQVPAGPAALAVRTGAPLLTAFTYRRPDNRSVVRIDPPLLLEQGATRMADIQHTMQAVMHIFESYIQHHPGQWVLTEPVWTSA